jgi:hypothetical protein
MPRYESVNTEKAEPEAPAKPVSVSYSPTPTVDELREHVRVMRQMLDNTERMPAYLRLVYEKKIREVEVRIWEHVLEAGR